MELVQEKETWTATCIICKEDFETSGYGYEVKCEKCKDHYRIPAQNLPYVNEKLEKLNKKADKLGCPRVTLTKVETVTEEFKIDEETTGTRTVYVMKLTGDAPKLNGWELAATLDHTFSDKGNIVKVAPNKQILDEYRTADNYCDHCGTRRSRKETFVVVNEQGEFKKVGRNCIADFLGHTNPSGFMRYAEWIRDLEEELEESATKGNGHSEPEFKLTTFLSFAAQVMLEHGWVSRSEAQYDDMKTSTAQQGWAEMIYVPRKGNWRDGPKMVPTEEALELVEKALAWANQITMPAPNDFLHNLALIADKQTIRWSEMGYAAAILRGYTKSIEVEQAKKLQEKRKEVSKHMHTVGERVTVTLSVDRITGYETQFGYTWVYIMSDSEGNVYVWKTGNGGMNVGDTVDIKGTVKDHTEFNGTKQTELTRCRVQ